MMSHEDWAQKPRQILKSTQRSEIGVTGWKKVITVRQAVSVFGVRVEIRVENEQAGKMATETQDGKDKENPGVRPLRGVKRVK